MRKSLYISVNVGGVTKSEHLLIAEKALGKPLPKRARVHHVNYDGCDNRNQNLVICDSQGYHMLLHWRQRTIEAGGDPNTQRVCAKCKQVKPLDSFRERPAPNGRNSYCRPCQSEIAHNYWIEHRDKRSDEQLQRKREESRLYRLKRWKPCELHPNSPINGLRRCIECLRPALAKGRAARWAKYRAAKVSNA